MLHRAMQNYSAGCYGFKPQFKGKSKRKSNAANERKCRIFSKAVPGGGGQLHAPPGKTAVRLRRFPVTVLLLPTVSGRLAPGRTSGLGNETVPPLPHARFTESFQHGGNAQMSGKCFAGPPGPGREAGTQPGTAAGRPSHLCRSSTRPDQLPSPLPENLPGSQGPKSGTGTFPKPEAQTARCRSVSNVFFQPKQAQSILRIVILL